MEVVAIKFKSGKYYAGCNKSDASTLLGAQLYKNEKNNMINLDPRLIHFNKRTY